MSFEYETFAEDLLAGDPSEAWRKAKDGRQSGRNSLYLYDQLMTPAMRFIGDLWEQNLISVADEHLASGVCDVLLSRYEQELGDTTPGQNKAMFLCLEGETHCLGLKMVCSLFREYSPHTSKRSNGCSTGRAYWSAVASPSFTI